jgi:acetyl esterase/lipase
MQTIPLWPGRPPLAVGEESMDVTTVTLYPAEPRSAAGGRCAAIVVCPGGGYGHLADHEGEPIARWLNTLGISAAVLRYRLGPRYHHPAPLLDAARALRTVRHRAGEWNIDPERVGILGFSAGGHLAATLSTQFEGQAASEGAKGDGDAVDRLSARPDLAVLLYPVITMMDPHTHAGSRNNLLPSAPAQAPASAQAPAWIEALSAERQVTGKTPPTFLFHTADDPAVPVENALAYAAALRAHAVPFELHIYESGPHGVGLAQNHSRLSSWPQRCAEWLAGRGFGG